MHTSEEVRELASAWTEDDPRLHGMLLAYADLLEAMVEADDGYLYSVATIRQRAAEKQKARKG